VSARNQNLVPPPESPSPYSPTSFSAYQPLTRPSSLLSLRTTSTAPTNQTGTSYATEVYFQVSWPWLVVPILSIPITLILLSLTILRSSRHQIPAWKSSQLAVLQALNPGIRAKLGDGMARNSELDEVVRREGVCVRLRGLDGGRWELGDE